METATMIDVTRILATGETVHWQRFNGEWASGSFIGMEGDLALIRASNGTVLVRLSALSW